MKQRTIIIVGAGLFGSIAATLCRQAGHLVSVLDSGESWAASKASGCVLAPSWLSSLSKAQIDESMETLASLYTVHDVAFKARVGHFRAKRVELKKVLVKPEAKVKVVAVGNGWVDYGVGGQEVVRARADRVLVAAGVASSNLVEMPPIKALWGASARISGQLKEPMIDVYAPYKQAVGFNLDDKTIWFGDGTALIESTWTKEAETRKANTLGRGAKMLGRTVKGLAAEINSGARPYVEGHKDGYFAKVFPNTYVSTGGAKNGTALAALQARMFLEAL